MTLSVQYPLFFSLFLIISPWAKKVQYLVLSNGNSCRELVKNKTRMCLCYSLLSLFSQRGASLLICFYPKQLLLPLVPHAQSSQPVLHTEYTQIYHSSFGSFTSSLQIRFARVSICSLKVFPHLLPECQGGEFKVSITKTKSRLGAGSSSFCLAVFAIGGKKSVTSSTTREEGICSTVQFLASLCTDKSMLPEQQVLSWLSRANRGH